MHMSTCLVFGICSQVVAANEDSLLHTLQRGVRGLVDARNGWQSMQEVCL